MTLPVLASPRCVRASAQPGRAARWRLLVALASAWLPMGCRTPSATGAVDSDATAGRSRARADLVRTLGERTVRFVGLPRSQRERARSATDELLAAYEASHGLELHLDDAAFELQLALRSAGHPRAEVSYFVDGDGATLLVDPGPEVRIGSVEIVGLAGATLPPSEVRAVLGEPERSLLRAQPPWVYDAERLRRAPERITAALVAEGDLDAQVRIELPAGEALAGEVAVRVVVERGRSYRLDGVALELDPGSTEGLPHGVMEALERARERALGPAAQRPRPYSPRLDRELYGGIVEALVRGGYPDAAVEVEPLVERATGRVQLSARVAAGPRVTLGGVAFAGAVRTRPRFLARCVELAEGDLYDASRVRADVRRLYRTGLFSEVRARPVGDGQQRDLVFDLQERSSREVWLEPGYGSYELVRLSGGWRDRNLFGAGRTLRAEGVAALRALRATVTLTDPWLLGNDLVGDLRATYDRRDEPSFVRLQRGLGAFVTREWFGRFTASFGYQFRRSEVRDVTVQDAELEDDPATVDLSTLRLTQRIDLRDDSFLPSRGLFAEAAVEYGASALGSELDFLRATLNVAGYRPLGPRSVLAASARLGLISPLGDDRSIPLQERFFNGGENTVRSFLESELGPRDRAGEPIGGEGFTTLGLEWRQMLTERLQGAVFADAGTLASDHTDVLRFEDVRAGVGLGLRYLLPIGPLRVDVAANPDPRSGEDDWAAHFSVGMAF